MDCKEAREDGRPEDATHQRREARAACPASFATTGTRAEGIWTRAYSQDLAAAYANHLNSLGLTDSSGQVLTLEGSSEGTFLAGTYYDHLLGTTDRKSVV